MTKKGRIYLRVFAVITFVALWSAVLFIVSPERLVELIGVNNVYLLVFIVGLFGGVSSLTIAPFFATLITAAAGGANPFILAVIGGITITLGDSIFYYLGWKGRSVVTGKMLVWVNKIEDWVRGKPIKISQAICFIYTGVTPFPNDVLMLAMAISRVPYLRIVGFIFAGNTTRVMIITLLAGTV